MKRMGTVPKEARPAMGKLINEAKTQLQSQLDAVHARLEISEMAAQVGPAVDATLPSPDVGPGTYHPLTLVREEMCRILRKVGFTVADGPEVETEYYCFDALNTPADHPARDATVCPSLCQELFSPATLSSNNQKSAANHLTA